MKRLFSCHAEERLMTAKPRNRGELSDEEQAIWARFDAEIQKGFDDIEAGRLKDADEIFERLEAKYAAMSRHAG
jgi:hypothetical protein